MSAPISNGTRIFSPLRKVMYCITLCHDSVFSSRTTFAKLLGLKSIKAGESSLTPTFYNTFLKAITLDSPILKTTEMDSSFTQLILIILGIFTFFLNSIKGECNSSLPQRDIVRDQIGLMKKFIKFT